MSPRRCSRSLPPTRRTNTSSESTMSWLRAVRSPPPAMTPELRQSLIEGEGFEVVPTQEHLVGMSLVAIGELTNIFFRMSWKLLRFDRSCLLTSDHPIVYWRETSESDAYHGIGPISAREVRVRSRPTLPSCSFIRPRSTRPMTPSAWPMSGSLVA